MIGGECNDRIRYECSLRYLVQDDPAQSIGPKLRSSNIVLTHRDPGFVSLVSILEIVWVLETPIQTLAFGADHVEMILAADTLEVQNEQEVYEAVVALRNGTGTFEDALISGLGAWRGCSATLRFDQNAAKRLNGFQLI